ncbi:TPM domain-containing protein [Moheibacter sediminis]|uniref:TPM domain-containing protein n=1 Tax=Moheibacter sediminis TaxID=1434700 RepID=A0A1W1ZQZ8_9FLAO|nr:TPM domain-containing protein [Moheibacter sediminis]SMC50518.1 uncharacterized protein SAMN06296427_103143 [Moheibacter sediminis]
MKNIILVLFAFSFINCISQKNETKKFDYTYKEAETILPKPIGLVNDFSFVFNQHERNELEKLLFDYSQKTTNQIAIVTVKNIEPYTDISDYAKDIGNFWGVGTREKDNGLIIVMDMSNRTIRISSGLGTEEILSDSFLKKIIDETIIPEFKQENYYSGIKSGIERIIIEWN